MPRKTPRAYELMPEILKLLKRDTQLDKPAIREKIKPFIRGRGYEERAQATNFALTYLKNEGYLCQLKRGVWAISDKGKEVNIAEEWSKAVVAKYQKRVKKRKSGRKKRPTT